MLWWSKSAAILLDMCLMIFWKLCAILLGGFFKEVLLLGCWNVVHVILELLTVNQQGVFKPLCIALDFVRLYFKIKRQWNRALLQHIILRYPFTHSFTFHVAKFEVDGKLEHFTNKYLNGYSIRPFKINYSLKLEGQIFGGITLLHNKCTLDWRNLQLLYMCM